MSSFLRRLLGTESIGDIPTRHIAVLLYLATTKRRKRLESPQKVADALGLGSENTVVRAYDVLLNRGYLAIAKNATKPDEPPGRDARAFEVTTAGKMALKPFFNVVGVIGLLGFVGISFLVGGMFGYLYALLPPYFPQYAAAIVGLSVVIVVVYVVFIYWVWRIAREFRRGQLFRMFRADMKSSE